MVFTSVRHLINKELLKKCHEKMDGDKAVGMDGVTKEEYGRNPEENLGRLVERLKRKSYNPQPARRVEIPKENGKTGSLSIYFYEDKLIQEALRRILPLPEIIKKLNQMFVGYYHYYGITDNYERIDTFSYQVRGSLFFRLNRRSRKRKSRTSGSVEGQVYLTLF